MDLSSRSVKRIAYGCTSWVGGGGLNYLVDLVERHDRTRFESVVFVEDSLVDASDALERLAAAHVSVHRGPMLDRWPATEQRRFWRDTLRREGPFDIANLHLNVPALGIGFVRGARAAGRAASTCR